MNLWAFRFMLWYICIMLVQPQNRFTFLWPLQIADLSFVGAVGLHVLSTMEVKLPIVRFGAATILAILLLVFAMIAQNFGIAQPSNAWNPFIDIIVKNSALLILAEAMMLTVARVWAVQMVLLFSTLWWVKGGLRLSAVGATTSGDRLMGAAVSLIENPNGFAYMMCVFLPLYLYAFQQAPKKWTKMFFLACALASIYIIFQTGSRTGLVTLIVMGIFLVPFYGKSHRKGMLAIVIAIALLYPLSGEGNMKRFRTIPQSALSFLSGKKIEKKSFFQMTQDEQSAVERQLKNHDTWGIIKENMFFGMGINPTDFTAYVDRFPFGCEGQVHCEILMAGKQMGLIGMGIYAGFIAIMFFGGRYCRLTMHDWPAVRDLGWTFQMQAVAIAVGGSFSPMPWHAPMMILAASASALMGIVKREQDAIKGRIRGL